MYNFREFLPYYKRNMAVALPVMITQAGQVLVQIADNIMVGHVGTAQLAGVSFANALFMIAMVTLIGFSQGLTPLVGQSIGKGESGEAAGYLRNSIVLNAIAYSIIFLILTGVLALMPRMGQDPEVLVYARQYFSINMFSLIPMLFFFTSRFFAEGVGNTSYAMWITVIANMMNILLNWILIFGHFGLPALGVRGAALSTLISRIFTAGVFAAILFRAEVFRKFTVQAFGSGTMVPEGKVRLSWHRMGEILRLSIPIAFSSMLEVTAFSFAAIMVGWMGKTELAAHQVANNLGQLSFLIATGVGAAATIRVSHQYGAGRYHETLMAGLAAIHMAVMYMCTCGTLFLSLRHLLPAVYTNDLEVISIASRLIVVLAMYQVVDAIQLTSISALRGLKDTKVPMIYAAVAYYGVAIPSGYLLGFTLGIGPAGVWYGLLAGLSVAAVLYYTRFRRKCAAMPKNG